MRNKVRRLERIRQAIQDGPCTVGALTDKLVARAILAHQRQLAINETLAHIAYLRWSGLIERRIRPDGIYEWFSTSDAPLDVGRTAPVLTGRPDRRPRSVRRRPAVERSCALPLSRKQAPADPLPRRPVLDSAREITPECSREPRAGWKDDDD